MSGQALEYIEIDIPYCVLSYGVAPCAAALGVTGTAKCFNTRPTCQDTGNIDLGTVTLRFAKPASYLPRDIDCLPSIAAIDYSPATVSLGHDLGQRAALTVRFIDHPHSDAGAGFDKYFAERGYDPYQRGSFWPRLRARHLSLQGVKLRWIMGFVGDAIADMETRHFFIESFDGPAADGSFSITAKDVLKFLDGDRARIPALSSGALVAAIDADDMLFTLQPSGVGDLEYPASGQVRIGGSEDCSFTRSSDTLTLVERALNGTEAKAHAAGDRVQLIQRYVGQDPANILNHAITTFSDLPASYIPLAEWQEETATHLGAAYTFIFGESIALRDALSRVIEQAGLALYDDDLNQKLRLKVIKSVPVTAETISEAQVLNGSFEPVDQPEKRVTRCHVRYAVNNHSKSLGDADNYRAVVLVEDEESETIYGAPAIRQIFADGIPAGGSSAASRLGNLVIGRYRRPPRRFKFSQLRGQAVVPVLGGGFNLDWRSLQDASGAREVVPVQIVRLHPGPALLRAEAEEMRFTALGEFDVDDRVIIISFDALGVNLKNLHDQLYPQTFGAGVTVRFIIAAGVTIGSVSATIPAVNVGDWPVGVPVTLQLQGDIRGAGGNGANWPFDAEHGGTALYTRHALTLETETSKLWGGGGGGGTVSATTLANGHTAGGGGAGLRAGVRGSYWTGAVWIAAEEASSGALEAGGQGARLIASIGGVIRVLQGGAGGAPGDGGGFASVSGVDGNFRSPGNGGSAIDGVSLVTVVGAGGDIRGPQVN